MKTFLKFSGIISFVLAVVAFILFLATPGLAYKNGNLSYSIQGTVAIFGGTVNYVKYAATWAGLLVFILTIVALIILCAGIVLPLLKVKALDKFAGILNLVAVVCLVLAGIFAFCIVAAFKGANSVVLDYGIGAGWVIAGIISIVAGCIACAPAIVDLTSKK